MKSPKQESEAAGVEAAVSSAPASSAPATASVESPPIDAEAPKGAHHDQHQEQSSQKVQVDMSNFVGRIKEKPVCTDEALKKEAMTTEELSKLTFSVIETKGHSLSTIAAHTTTTTAVHEPSVVSSSSSTASRESAWSDHEDRTETSERINLKVTTQTISRNGRQSQRWQTDSERVCRLVTGCVPIVEGGKILFASASRKSEWILPKGGWEKDEEMEESAIRETFEEAGVLGILGPRLSEIEYETRKAKKRRLDFQEIQRKAKQIRDAHSSVSKAVPTPVVAVASSKNGREKDKSPPQGVAQAPPAMSSSPLPVGRVDDKVLHRIRGHAAKSMHHSSDCDTASVASESSTGYTHVKMTLIPLYVTEVRNEWPEQGRFRKAVDIDEAIRLTESRPEFQAALKEVKERNLHLLPQMTKAVLPSGSHATAKTTKSNVAVCSPGATAAEKR